MQNPADVLPILSEPHVFDARGVARRFRHAAIFGALDSAGRAGCRRGQEQGPR